MSSRSDNDSAARGTHEHAEDDVYSSRIMFATYDGCWELNQMQFVYAICS